MPSAMQRSFAGGVIAPALYGRADQAKYQTGLRTCENFMVQRYGGVANRPGTRFVIEVKDSTKNARLIPFDINETNSYVLEFGDLYVRFIKNGTQLESGGGAYEIVSPYAHTDLADLQFAQLNDVITITHQSYPVYELKRFADTNWTLTKKTFIPSISRPAATVVTKVGAGAVTEEYRVTAIDSTTGEESLVSFQTLDTITGISNASPAVVTVNGAALTYANGDRVWLSTMVGMDEVEEREFEIANVAGGPNYTFDLVGEDSSGYGAFTSGNISILGDRATGNAPAAGAGAWTINWSEVTGAGDYFIWKLDSTSGIFGLIGTKKHTGLGTGAFSDTGITPDTTFEIPSEGIPFYAAGKYPRTVAYHQQRLWFASTANEIERIWASRLGNFEDFAVGVNDDKPFSFQIAGGNVSEVRSLMSLGKLLVFTSSSEWSLEGNEYGALTPTSINPRQHSYDGANYMQPVAIGNNALFVQSRGKMVRDFRYQLQVDGYGGQDLSIFVPHLFDDVQDEIVRWSFQQIPHSILWCVKENGECAALTYLTEHDIWGWHVHSTGALGLFKDVVTVPERQTVYPEDEEIVEDFTYFLIERYIDGSNVKYIERLASRDRAVYINNMTFSDSFLSYDGTNLTLAGFDDTATATLSGGPPWTTGSSLTLTMGANTFVAGDVGNGMWMTGADGENIFVEITAYTSPTVVTCKPDRNVPASLQSTATTTWAKAVDEVTGLDHLEGETCSILADGLVITPQAVASGELSFPRPYAIIHAGLPVTADMETLDIESLGETLIDKRKRVNRVTLLVASTLGLWAGPDEDNLIEIKQIAGGGYDYPVTVRTEPIELLVRGTWNNHGRTLVRQSDPFPATILAIAPSTLVGG